MRFDRLRNFIAKPRCSYSWSCLSFLGFFDLIRVFQAVVRSALLPRSDGDGQQPQRDLDQVRAFLAGAGPGALFDLPWIPLYVAICFLFHPLWVI